MSDNIDDILGIEEKEKTNDNNSDSINVKQKLMKIDNAQSITFIELLLLLIFVYVSFTQPFWHGNTFADMFKTVNGWNGETKMRWGPLWYLKISPIFIALWALSSIFSINNNQFNFNFILLKFIGIGYFIGALSFYPKSFKQGGVYLFWISILALLLIIVEAFRERKNISILFGYSAPNKDE